MGEPPVGKKPKGIQEPEPPPGRILLVDCDMFYVQVARLEDPEGVGREELLIVGGTPTGRGVVTSASYGVREYGVRSGMPASQALRLCPEAKIVPVSRRACLRWSQDVLSALQKLSPVVQAASIDEFYLDLQGTERLFHQETLTQTARRMREEVLAQTQVSVSIGGGTRRLIAKLASGRAKPAGVHVVPPGGEEAFMQTFKLREIPGVGPALAGALQAKGLTEVRDILPVEISWLEKWLGPQRAEWLWKRARGMDSSRVNPSEPRKSISSERTFSYDLTDDRLLEKELLRETGTVGQTLRKKGLKGRTVTVKVRDPDFRTRTASHTLPDPIEADTTLFSVAQNLFRELRKKRRMGVRLLGVGISSLVEGDEPPQLDLFQAGAFREPERDRVVSRVMDDIQDRFGSGAILPGRMLEDEDDPPKPTSLKENSE